VSIPHLTAPGTHVHIFLRKLQQKFPSDAVTGWHSTVVMPEPQLKQDTRSERSTTF
jgi:hypothetical protein